MRITWASPSDRFDNVSFTSEILDGRAGPLTTTYTCPACGSKLGFTKENFETRASRRISNLAPETAAAFDRAAQKRDWKDAAFLDWNCQGCGLAVRAYSQVWVAGRGDYGADIQAVAEEAR